jgi:cytochrome P450
MPHIAGDGRIWETTSDSTMQQVDSVLRLTSAHARDSFGHRNADAIAPRCRLPRDRDMASVSTSPPLSIDDLDSELGRLMASEHEAIQNPQRLYAGLRQHAPVHRVGSRVFVSRYAGVKEVLGRAEEFGNDFQGEGTAAISSLRESFSSGHRRMFDEVKGRERMFLTEIDGDAHRRRRRVAAHLFTPRRVAELQPLSQRFVDEVLDESAARGAADVDYCSWRIPACVSAALLGFPISDVEMVVGWCDEIEAFLFGATGVERLEASYHAHRAMEEYVLQMLADHRSGRRTTQLMDALLTAEEGEVLSEAEVANMVLHVQLAGFETTRILLSGGLYALLRNREQWERLVAMPELAAPATEELLRYTSPAQWTGRVPLRDATIGEETVAPGDTLYVLFASANHDPEVFEDPETLDITRENAKQHVAFSHGIHHCLGAALARLEGQIWFGTLARRFPDLALSTESVDYVGNAVLRRLAPYHVTL